MAKVAQTFSRKASCRVFKKGRNSSRSRARTVLNWERNEAGVGRSEEQTGHYRAAWVLKGFLGVTAALGCVPPKPAPVTSAFLCAAIRSHRQRTQRMATV